LQDTLTALPRWVPAQLEMGSLLWQAGLDEQAGEWFASASEQAPWSGEAAGTLAYFWAVTGRGKPDLPRLETEARGLPYSGLSYELGRVYRSPAYQDLDRALDWLALAVDHAVDDVATRQALAECRIERGEYDAAASEFRRIVELSGEVPDAWRGLGYSLLSIGDVSGAEAAYEIAIRLHPDSAQGRLGYGVALLRLGNAEAAVSELVQATSLAPTNGEAFLALAEALAATGDLPAAISAVEQARANLHPSDERPQELRSRLVASR